MATRGNVEIKALDLRDNSYTIEQSLIRNKYKATDKRGNTVLRGSQKMFKMKEEFPFTDGNGNDVFTVKAGGIIDVAGNYVLKDEATGEDVVILDNDYSILQDTWKIRDARTEAKIAEINSRGAATTLARNLLPFGEIIPHKYEITDRDGDQIGKISGQLSLRDTYEVTVNPSDTEVPTEPVLAAAMVIDAIQGN